MPRRLEGLLLPERRNARLSQPVRLSRRILSWVAIWIVTRDDIVTKMGERASFRPVD
jgi:hypothetical protein